MPKLDDDLASFLGGAVDRNTASKITEWTFKDLKALADAFDKLPPRKRKQAKAMCCCSMCCCAAAVPSMHNSDQVR